MENGAPVVVDQFFSTINLKSLLAVLEYFESLYILLLAHHNAIYKIVVNELSSMKRACANFKVNVRMLFLCSKFPI